MSVDELTDLLHTASRAAGGDVRADPAALIARARRGRRRQRMVGIGAVMALVLAAAVAIPPLLDRKDGTVDLATGTAEEFRPGWTRLPDPPLRPRTGATAATVGDEVVVVGGTQQFCRPLASCTPESTGEPGVPSSNLTDGAAFNLRTRKWRSISPAPVGFRNAQAVVVDGAMVLAACEPTICEDGLSRGRLSALLRYRPATDRWEELPSPPSGGSYLLSKLGGSLVAYVPYGSEPYGSERRPDWRLDEAKGIWSQLPDDPLPPLAQRQMVAAGDDLVLLGLEINEPGSAAVARLDGPTGTWTTLPPAPASYFNAWYIDGKVVLIGQAGAGAGGGIFDLASGVWNPLPKWPVADTPAGAVGPTSSGFQSLSGWVLDVASGIWTDELEADARNAAVTSFGRRLFRFGGEASAGKPSGELLGDAWVWTPPDPRVASPADGITDPSLVPTSVPTSVPTITPTTLTSIVPPATGFPPTALTAAPPPPDAPSFVSASGTLGAPDTGGGGGIGNGRITVRFSRPVAEGVSPASPCCPEGYLAAMSLIVYGADSTCSTPAGNAHAYLAGMGTDTITTDATSLVVGTTYISIGSQFVRDAATGRENTPVVCVGIPVKP